MMNLKKRPLFIRMFSLFVCVFFFCSSFSLAENSDFPSSADTFFDDLFEKENPVGAVVIISQGENVLYTYTTGYADRKNKVPVRTDSLFKIASVTKLITALGLMHLNEQANLDFDAPLGQITGHKMVNPLRNDTPFTLRQVMSHTSSLSKDANYYPQWGNNEQAESYFTHFLPGSHYEYANLNGGIIGSLVELLSGKSLHDYMEETFFTPLETDAAYSPALLLHPEKMGCTYTKERDLYMNQEHYLENAANYDNTSDPDHHYHYGVGSIWMSAEGLSKFGQMLACGGTLDHHQYLQPETIRLMCADQSLFPQSSVSCQSPYGLSMHRLESELFPDRWYGHQGCWQGMVCDLYFEPYTQTSVVMIVNGSPHKRRDSETAFICLKTLSFVTDTWMDAAVGDWQ